MSNYDDLDPANGCARGCLVAGLLWVVIILVVAIVIVRCVP